MTTTCSRHLQDFTWCSYPTVMTSAMSSSQRTNREVGVCRVCYTRGCSIDVDLKKDLIISVQCLYIQAFSPYSYRRFARYCYYVPYMYKWPDMTGLSLAPVFVARSERRAD